MLHNVAPHHLTFITTCRHYPIAGSQRLRVQVKPIGPRVNQPLARRVSSLGRFDDTDASQLRLSSFARREKTGTRLHRRSKRLRSVGNPSESRGLVRASSRHPREASKASGQKLFLIDARWFIIQAHNEVSSGSSAARESQFLRGCVSALVKFLNGYTHSHSVLVVFPNHKQLTQLKSQSSHRKIAETHGTSRAQFAHLVPVLKKLCRTLGVEVYSDDTHESRDIIGSLVRKSSDTGIPAVIVSSDSDFLQLLESHNVTFMKPGTDAKFEHISEQLFSRVTHGLHPRQYIDLRALIGKKGSCGGIPDIKHELAALLVSRFGTAEAIILDAKTSITGTTTSFTEGGKDGFDSELRVFLSRHALKSLVQYGKEMLQAKQLVSIRQDLDVDIRLCDLRRGAVNRSKVVRVLQAFDDFRRKQTARRKVEARYKARKHQPFDAQNRDVIRNGAPSSLERYLRLSTPTVTDADSVRAAESRPASKSVTACPSDEELEEFLSTTGRELGLVPVFGTDPNCQKLTGIAVGGPHGRALFIDFLSHGCVPQPLVHVLESKFVEKRGLHLRELYKHLLTEHEIMLKGTLFDVRVALDLLNAGEETLGDLANNTGSGENILYALLSDRSKASLNFSVDQSIFLCCALNQLTARLRDKLEQDGLLLLALRIEFPLIRVLGSMEINGVPLDRTELSDLRTRCSERLCKIEDKIKDRLSSHTANSTCEKAALSTVSETWFPSHGATNKTSAAVSNPTSKWFELQSKGSNTDLPNDHRMLANLFVEREDLSKFIARDIAALFKHVQTDGRVRTTFVQGPSVTGRLATRNPNLQNVPGRSQLGRELRNAFRAESGMCILCADYSQIELRIVASLCGDPFMIDAFSAAVDIHRCIAGKIFDVPITNVTNIQRNQAKQVIYSILYGVSATGLSERLGVPVREAENLLSEFKIEFPCVQELANRLVEEASNTGYAKTLLGRRLPLPRLVSGESSERRAASRKAINMPIQGTQADMIKLSMVRIHERLQASGARSNLVLQIHDELLLEVADPELDAVTSLVEEEMTSALPLTGVDVAIKIRYGPSWSKCTQPIFSRG